jgi:hypothetical protein
MDELSFAGDNSGGPMKGIAIAAGVLIVVAGAVFWFNPHKQAEGHLISVQTLAPKTQFTGLAGSAGTHVIGTGPAEEQDLYVVATVQVDNQLRIPLFVDGERITLVQPDNTEVQGRIVGNKDIPRLTESFPALVPMVGQPLPFQAEAPPKGSITGSIVVQFPDMTEEQWKGKKSGTLTVLFEHQDPLQITLP